MSESNSCLDSSTSLSQSINRPINSCFPVGQAFPQMLSGMAEFRKTLMATMQTDVNPRDVLQNQGMLCIPSMESSHLQQPIEQLERQRQRNRQRMKNLRLDPEFRAQERLRQRQRMFLKRQDPHFREKERLLQRIRVREKRTMFRPLEPRSGLRDRQNSSAHTSSDVSQDNSSPSNSHVPTSNNGASSGGPTSNQPNSSVTVYGTLIEGSQLGQHLLLPNNLLAPGQNDTPHLQQRHHHHNGDHNSPECPGVHRGCPGTFNFEMCRNNMLPNCKVCMKLYQDLFKHARGHKRNHHCLICGRLFRLKQHLKGHMKTHGDKNLACPHCPYKTCYNFALNRHIILKHSQNRANVPPVPSAIASAPSSLQCQLMTPQIQPLDVSQPMQLSKCSTNVES